MEVVCYMCNMETVSYLQNLTEIKSKHSGTQINKFVEKLLGDHRSDRNVDDEKNCICLKCLEKIFTFDFMWVQVSEQEKTLRQLLLSTEMNLSKNLRVNITGVKNEIVIIDPPTDDVMEINLDETICVEEIAVENGKNIKSEDTSQVPTKVLSPPPMVSVPLDQLEKQSNENTCPSNAPSAKRRAIEGAGGCIRFAPSATSTEQTTPASTEETTPTSIEQTTPASIEQTTPASTEQVESTPLDPLVPKIVKVKKSKRVHARRSSLPLIRPKSVSSKKSNRSLRSESKDTALPSTQKPTQSLTAAEELIKCQICSDKFNTQNWFKQHIETIHPNAQIRFICRNCDKSYSTKSNFNNHVRTQHNDVDANTVICEMVLHEA